VRTRPLPRPTGAGGAANAQRRRENRAPRISPLDPGTGKRAGHERVQGNPWASRSPCCRRAAADRCCAETLAAAYVLHHDLDLEALDAMAEGLRSV
jgi:hypothetical protein